MHILVTNDDGSVDIGFLDPGMMSTMVAGDIADIARRLRVRNVLEGSVRKSGSRVRITAQLIDASNGYHLWSDTYDRTLEDVFAVQDEIASHVAEALKVALLDEGAAQPEHPTENIDAYLAYLQGQQALGDAGEGGNNDHHDHQNGDHGIKIEGQGRHHGLEREFYPLGEQKAHDESTPGIERDEN